MKKLSFLVLAMTASVCAVAESEITVSLNSSSYVKVAESVGSIQDLSLSGITAFDGAAQTAFACVSNRPYGSSSTAQSGLPSGAFVHQLSVFNAWTGTRTYSYRVQLAQPDGTEDLYARITAVTISREGVNLVDHPDLREIRNEKALVEYSYTGTDAEFSNYSVTALTLSAAPYIESLGSSGISTGYRMKGGISRVEVDFALATTENSRQWRVFGDTTHETTLGTMFYYTGTGSGVGGNHTFRVRGTPNFNASANDPLTTGDSQWTTGDLATANLNRYTLVTDLKNGKNQIVSESTTYTANFNANLFTGLVADLPLSLFGQYGNDGATAFANCAKAKIYGVRIYENDALVHDFAPCLKDGEEPCFKDLVGGGFIVSENAAAFTAGGDLPTYQDNAYVSTAANADGGKLYIDTGCKITDNTTVELDCALTAKMPVATADSSNWFLFDCNNTARFNMGYLAGSTSGKMYYLQFTAGGNGTAVFDDTLFAKPSSDSVINMRRTFILDNYRTCAAVATAGFTNRVVTFSRTKNSGSSGNLALASYCGGAATYRTPLKIYGCKIYESGELVHDFKPYVKNGVPGLLDDKTGNFVAGTDSSNSGNILAYGGEIVGEGDAYIESNGANGSGMSTGYKMQGAVSRVEVDFRFVTPVAQKYIYGSSADSTIQTFLYTTGSGVGDSFKFCQRSPTQYDTQWVCTPDTVRRVAVTDLKNKKNSLTPSPVGNSTQSFTYDFAGKTATLPLTIFGKYSTAAATAIDSCPNARIYSVRFYENYVEGGDNTPVRELIPYKNGDVVGFYDTVTGEIVKNDSAAAGAFTFGGAGTDGGNLKCYIKPGYMAKLGHGNTATLTAYAPGAVSYRWLCDGEPIYGGTAGTLTVPWTRKGEIASDGLRHHSYQAVAVFNIYGAAREGEPSAVAEILSRPLGTTIILR